MSPTAGAGARSRKASIGRRKVVIKRIQDEEKRQVCFSKRRTGLFKKASDLSILCGAEVAIVTFSPAGNPFSFGHPSVEDVVTRAQQFLEAELANTQASPNGIDDNDEGDDDDNNNKDENDEGFIELKVPALPAASDVPSATAAADAVSCATKMIQKHGELLSEIESLKLRKAEAERGASVFNFHKSWLAAALDDSYHVLGCNDLLRLRTAMGGLRDSIRRREKSLQTESTWREFLMASASTTAERMRKAPTAGQRQLAGEYGVQQGGGMLGWQPSYNPYQKYMLLKKQQLEPLLNHQSTPTAADCSSWKA